MKHWAKRESIWKQTEVKKSMECGLAVALCV